VSTLSRVPEKYVHVDGNATFLRHVGPTTLPDASPDVSRGEVVLCLHGSVWTSASFARVLSLLGTDHSPLAFDFPAHGRSGGIDSLGSVERLAAYTRGVVEKLGLRPLVLIGHELGGAVALEYALRFSGDVRGLLLCNAAARFELDPALVERVERVSEGKKSRFFRSELYSPSASRELLGSAFMEELKTDPRVVLGNLRALSEWSFEERLPEIEAPTSVIAGEDEPEHARTRANRLAARVAGAGETAIAGAGGAIPLEQPEALARALCDFVRERVQ
jgi:pimeloyl-ACP methyl ester carboxylesterase